jgi:sarcosine oxidase, subunit beta
MTSECYDALIIGGGIQGCATALFLGRAKWRVAVLEKDYAGRHASGVNAGGVRVLGRDLPEIPLALEACALWHELGSLVGDACGFTVVGNVRVAETDADFEKLKARSKKVAALGLDYREEILERDELRQRVPGIAGHCVGAIASWLDGYAEPFRTTTAFRHAAERAGARVVERCEVSHFQKSGSNWMLETKNGRHFSAPVVVNCAGAWGSRVAALLGDSIPMAANGSMQFVTERLPIFVKPVVGSATRPLSLKQFQNGTVVIGGGQRAPVDLDTNKSDISVRGLAIAARAACTVFPELRRAQMVRAWSGIEGFTSDKLPVIGPGTAGGVFHAFGFSGHGFQLGPAVGKTVAHALINGEIPQLIKPFAPGRLAIKAGT